MLHIVKYKGCVRCGGDLFLERDPDGIYISCLQCGGTYVPVFPKILKNTRLIKRKRPAKSPVKSRRPRPRLISPAP